MKNITTKVLQNLKEQNERFAVVSAYDATFAQLISNAGIEVILVGDSLGMVLQGLDSTLPVTLEQMCYHTESVGRGNQGSLIIADMPFMTFHTPEAAMANATALMQSGAHMVKLEGGAWLCETVSLLVERGIPVCAHLGLTPQSVNTLGGFRVQGRDPEQAEAILKDACLLEDAGAELLVVECIPTDLAEQITDSLAIPVIGIGAGPLTNAQVLVAHDMLGLNPKPPRFVRNFLEDTNSIQEAFALYLEAVRDGSFPSDEHCFN